MALRTMSLPADRGGARRGSLMHIVERCEGTLGWQPPAAKKPKPIDETTLDFSTCASDADRNEVRKSAENVAAAMASSSVYRVEVGKLRNAMSKNPKLYTPANLELSLEWCWKKRLRITSPVALIYHVEDALKLAAEPPPVIDIIDARNAAIEYEKHHADANSERWLRRLGRAQGAGLVATMDEWRFARGR